MRTTLTLDSDVAQRLRQEMERRGQSLKVVVNEGLREALSRRERTAPAKLYRVRPLRLDLRPGIDPDKLGQLLDELEVEEYAKKMDR
jgi:ActR/RegA family two-component response regulator